VGSHPLNERIGKHRGKPGEVIQRAEAMFVIVMAKNRGLMRKSGTREQMVYAMAVAWALASMATSMYDCTSDGCEEVARAIFFASGDGAVMSASERTLAKGGAVNTCGISPRI
jgi:hypothetical protein